MKEEVRGILLALEDEKKSLKASRAKLKAEQDQVGEMKQAIRKERHTVLEAVAKLMQVDAQTDAKVRLVDDVLQVDVVVSWQYVMQISSKKA